MEGEDKIRKKKKNWKAKCIFKVCYCLVLILYCVYLAFVHFLQNYVNEWILSNTTRTQNWKLFSRICFESPTFLREKMGSEGEGFTQTDYVRADTRTTAHFIQTDVCYKCITDLLKVDLSAGIWNYYSSWLNNLYLREMVFLSCDLYVFDPIYAQ